MNKKLFDKLQVGDIIQNKKSTDGLIVAQVFPERIVAVQVVTIVDFKDWDLVQTARSQSVEESLEKIKQWQMSEQEGNDRPSIQECAGEIDQYFRPKGWLQMVGVNSPIDDTILIYTSHTNFKKPFEDTYRGYKVIWKNVGKVMPG